MHQRNKEVRITLWFRTKVESEVMKGFLEEFGSKQSTR